MCFRKVFRNSSHTHDEGRAGLLTASLDFIQSWSYIIKMNKFLSIQKAAAFLGVSTQTLRRWERSKKIEPAQRTAGGQRRYDITKLQPARLLNAKTQNLPTIAYANLNFGFLS